MDQAEITASRRLRLAFLVVAALMLLIGAIAGHGRHVARARPALFVGVGTLCVGDAMGWG
jgi:hypothetical protein